MVNLKLVQRSAFSLASFIIFLYKNAIILHDSSIPSDSRYELLIWDMDMVQPPVETMGGNCPVEISGYGQQNHFISKEKILIFFDFAQIPSLPLHPSSNGNKGVGGSSGNKGVAEI